MNPEPPIPPVITTARSVDRLERFLRWVGLAVLICLLLLGVAAYAATGFFRPSAEMAGLRDSLQAVSGQSWQRVIHLNVGSVTCGAVRAGLSFVEMGTEARIALRTIRGCEVGIYQVLGDTDGNHPVLLAAADEAMEQQGWERVVGAMDEEHLVAVYVPANLNSTARMKCAVLVCRGRQLILASTRANLDAAIQFGLNRVDSSGSHSFRRH